MVVFVGETEEVAGIVGDVGDEGGADDAGPDAMVLFDHLVGDDLADLLFGVFFTF